MKAAQGAQARNSPHAPSTSTSTDNEFVFPKNTLPSQYICTADQTSVFICLLVLHKILFQIITRCDFRWDLCFLLRYTERIYIANVLKLIQGESTFIFFRWRENYKTGHEVEESVSSEQPLLCEVKRSSLPTFSC